VTGECVVQFFADASSSRCILETVSERVEDTCFVRNAELPLVASEPFRPRLSEAALGTGCEKREEAAPRSRLSVSSQRTAEIQFGSNRDV